jgi:hypothetical protein
MVTVIESLRERNHCEIVQARKALAPYVFELIGTGQKDKQRLMVFAQTYLKTRAKPAKPLGRCAVCYPAAQNDPNQ